VITREDLRAAELPVTNGGSQPGSDTSAPDEHRPASGDERVRIIAVLEACGGNQSRAAKRLGISRNTLISRIREFGLARPHAR
jgi:transcriptional regulator of acetoin/glycerol metabolism